MPLERCEASTLDVLDRVLDKGVIVDYRARVTLLGVDLLTIIEGRAIVASIDTHLRYAEPIRKSGLTPAYPEGALHQALTPLPPRAHPPKSKGRLRGNEAMRRQSGGPGTGFSARRPRSRAR